MNFVKLTCVLIIYYFSSFEVLAQSKPFFKKHCVAHKHSIKFEEWLQKKIHQENVKRTTEEVIRIPVVVHIIHNGEPIGEGANVAKDQILSQIRILNEDFRRKPDTNGFNTHIAGADTKIEFELAVRTPEDLPTDGIVRKQGSKTTWSTLSVTDRLTLKAHSFWNPSHYLNIWVANIQELVHWGLSLL